MVLNLSVIISLFLPFFFNIFNMVRNLSVIISLFPFFISVFLCQHFQLGAESVCNTSIML